MKRIKRLASGVLAVMMALSGTTSAYAKSSTVKMKTVVLTVGKSKTVKAGSNKKIKWSISNKKIAAIKSAGKAKVKITAKKAGNAKVTGKAGKRKWTFKIKVNNKKSKRAKSKGIKSLDSIEVGVYREEGYLDPQFFGGKFSKMTKFSSSDENIVKVKGGIGTGDNYVMLLLGRSPGTATITVSNSKRTDKYKIKVTSSVNYKIAKNFISAVNSSGLDDAHKALATAGWLANRVSYGWGSGDPNETTLSEGKGVCGDYAHTYQWLLRLESIDSRFVETSGEGGHDFNQILINNKWYNVDVTWFDADDFLTDFQNKDDVNSALFRLRYFMKSDYFSPDGEAYPFNDKCHKVNNRYGNYWIRFFDSTQEFKRYTAAIPKAESTDYDNYDWLPFVQSEQFFNLVNK